MTAVEYFFFIKNQLHQIIIHRNNYCNQYDYDSTINRSEIALLNWRVKSKSQSVMCYVNYHDHDIK